ncbi:CDK5RAP3-like protein [Diorhabda carinulata]|uniref:CDK5RAP3-like protein n=1 Tax=Diorhabda carinulata TaxID=1163345 RepID=UPI0025A2A0DB|nr:CDK5RAP3-like protein [Diorhabda carinulata]
MDEQNIPIDINTAKLLDWLISRRHVKNDWQNNILKIREKINNAIQDMPADKGIIKLLSGQHINYFHCLKIIEILKETEADTKNVFGRYGSQRMKDWQDVISQYQKDNVYLAEVAQMLIRNVSFEIPSLKKQIAKLEQNQLECEKKIKDYSRIELTTQREFKTSCDQLKIEGCNIKRELLKLLKDLPEIYQTATERIKLVEPAVELYNEFNKYLSAKKSNDNVLPVLEYLIKFGNTTTYEYIYGEQPIVIEETSPDIPLDSSPSESDKIDFGDIDFGDNVTKMNIDIDNEDTIDFGDNGNDQNIDWGTNNSEEGFEIVSHADLDINLEESGIVVEKTGLDGGVAKGEEALTILDNPKIQEQVINNLVELSAFITMRLYEMMNDTDMLATAQMQEASTTIQMQTIESITALNDYISVALEQLTNKRTQHLHNIKHSPKYVDILTANLNQKLTNIQKMKTNKKLLEEKIKSLGQEIRDIEPIIKRLIEQSKQLQKDIQDDISKKYKGRIVNLTGGVNAL